MPLRAECFRELNSRKHGVRSAVIDFVACYRRDARMFSRNSRKHVARSAVTSLLAWLVQDDHTANKLLENIPHEEVFRECTIIGIFFDSCIAKARQANRHEMLFERSEFIE